MQSVPSKHRSVFALASGLPAPPALVQRWRWWIGGYRGLALGPLILVRDPSDVALVCHELTHVAQFRAHPWTYWLRYALELCRCGYERNRYEIEARAVQEKALHIAAGTTAPQPACRRCCALPVGAPAATGASRRKSS